MVDLLFAFVVFGLLFSLCFVCCVLRCWVACYCAALVKFWLMLQFSLIVLLLLSLLCLILVGCWPLRSDLFCFSLWLVFDDGCLCCFYCF